MAAAALGGRRGAPREGAVGGARRERAEPKGREARALCPLRLPGGGGARICPYPQRREPKEAGQRGEGAPADAPRLTEGGRVVMRPSEADERRTPAAPEEERARKQGPTDRAPPRKPKRRPPRLEIRDRFGERRCLPQKRPGPIPRGDPGGDRGGVTGDGAWWGSPFESSRPAASTSSASAGSRICALLGGLWYPSSAYPRRRRPPSACPARPRCTRKWAQCWPR